MLRCSRGQTDFQRLMVKYEIARQKKTIETWLDIILTITPRPDPAGTPVTTEVS